MKDVMFLGGGRYPVAFTSLPKEEWPESITVYHSGHYHDETPRFYTKSNDASQGGLVSTDGLIEERMGGKSSGLVSKNIDRVLSSTIRDSCEDVDDAETLLDEAKQIIRCLYNENIDLCKACGDDCPTFADIEGSYIETLKQRIRVLESENDSLARENADLKFCLHAIGVKNERG